MLDFHHGKGIINNLKEGMVYVGSWYQRFQSIIILFLRLWETEHHDGEYIANQNCLPPRAWETMGLEQDILQRHPNRS